MTAKSIDQQRAAAALATIAEYRRAAATERKAYVGYLKGAGAMIVMNGLGQAAATWLERGGSEGGRSGGTPAAYHAIYAHLSAWLMNGCPHSPYRAASGPRPSLIEAICAGSQEDYLLAQAEALVYLEWLKKLANGLLLEPAHAG